jgi:hypothetical protein
MANVPAIVSKRLISTVPKLKNMPLKAKSKVSTNLVQSRLLLTCLRTYLALKNTQTSQGNMQSKAPIAA